MISPGHDFSSSVTTRLHRAPWLVTALAESSEPAVVNDGAVLVAGRIIRGVGRFADLAREYPLTVVVDHEQAILVPALINCHAHLELSCLAGLGRWPVQPGSSFPDWIRELIDLRRQTAARLGDSLAATVAAAATRALAGLRKSGVGLVVDIGNMQAGNEPGQGLPVEVMFLLELLGISREGEQAALQRLAGRDARPATGVPDALGPDLAVTGHSPYATGPKLLQELKARAAVRNGLFSLHVAESIAEEEFLRSGTGPMHDFLIERSGGYGSFTVPGVGAVAYLDRLGLLDRDTLCVHAVQVSDADIDILAARGAGVCLCPGSNRQLAVGKAPVPALLDAGIRPVLGTDSLASNPRLNLWQEMRLLRQDHPGVEPAAIFAMATNNGAAALGLAGQWGRLAPGRTARFLAVANDRVTAVDQVCDYLTATGASLQCTWIEE
ncbi:MAG: amidohydrolase family protein [Desulfobacterales bacterium]|nr:amidohydrolase family protein [Desulfobacterales bacterium]